MQNVILLDTVPKLPTSYGRNGKTRDARGKPWQALDLVTCDAAATRNKLAWSTTRGMVRDLELLDERVRGEGASGIRLTDLVRAIFVQQRERSRYATWVAAGKPDPGTALFSATTMRTTYVAPAGESFHNCGLAVDLDIYALDFPKLVGNAALAKLWELSEDLGFRPVISDPKINASEAWHFDHMGPLSAVYDLFRAQGGDYRPNAYGLTARVGVVLTGQFTGDRRMERLVQSRLLLGGFFLGEPDGIFGKKTLGVLKELGIKANGATPPAEIITQLDEQRVALDAIEAA